MKHPFNLSNKKFIENSYEHYKWLRENAPVYKGKFMFIPLYFVSRYEDVQFVLKDSRFLRNRGKSLGKSRRYSFPLPKIIKMLMNNVILADGVDHRRLRSLVHKAFTPRSVAGLKERIEKLTQQLLDKMGQNNGTIDLLQAYALPIPVTVIADLVGVPDEYRDPFLQYSTKLVDKVSIFKIIGIYRNISKLTELTRKIIQIRREAPEDDLITGLIQAEEEGDKLNEDELISMVFMLIFAGYETTVHLIGNAVYTLLKHPDQLALLRKQPELMDSAIEEVMRYNPPVHGTKLHHPVEDITIQDVTIPRGKAVMALLAAANRDERKFENPDVFDITREKNQQMGFGGGIHYCLGAPLARLETKIALHNLIQRYPNLQFSVPPEQIQRQIIPAWHRLKSLPVKL